MRLPALTPARPRALVAALAAVTFASLALTPASLAQVARPAATTAPVAAAASSHASAEAFRVSLFAAQQIDRFNPGIAASQNSVASGGMVLGVDLDMHVADVWMPKKVTTRPMVMFTGRLLAGERVLAQTVETAVDTLTGEAPDSIEVFPHAKAVELIAGLKLAYPVQMLRGVPQTALFLKAETGATFAEHMTGDLLSTTRIGLGFERMSGTFAGSLVEVLSGHNESFGSSHASGRYAVHVLIRGALGAPEGATLHRSPLGAFVDLEVDTDNQGGPDGVRALMGLTLDGDGIFAAVRGLVGI